jgi:hypothetical protein
MVIKVLEAPTFRSPISGQQAVTGTAAALATHECVQIIVKALSSNPLPVYIGPSTVTTTNGFELSAGESVVVEVEKVEFLYVIAASTGSSVCWLAKKVQ